MRPNLAHGVLRHKTAKPKELPDQTWTGGQVARDPRTGPAPGTAQHTPQSSCLWGLAGMKEHVLRPAKG